MFVNLSSLSIGYGSLVTQLGVVAASVHQTCLKTNKELILEMWKPYLNWTYHPEV